MASGGTQLTDEELSTLGRTNKNRGKSNERRVAAPGGPLQRHFGEPFVRNPITGRALADCESEHHVVEVKHRQRGPWALFRDAWAQADSAHEQTGKIPHVLLTFKEKGKLVDYIVTRIPRE